MGAALSFYGQGSAMDTPPCQTCGSVRTIPYTTCPPIVGKKGEKKTAHTCTPACDRQGTLCLACRIAR